MNKGLTLYQRDDDGVMRNVGTVVSWSNYWKAIRVAGKVYTLEVEE